MPRLNAARGGCQRGRRRRRPRAPRPSVRRRRKALLLPERRPGFQPVDQKPVASSAACRCAAAASTSTMGAPGSSGRRGGSPCSRAATSAAPPPRRSLHGAPRHRRVVLEHQRGDARPPGARVSERTRRSSRLRRYRCGRPSAPPSRRRRRKARPGPGPSPRDQPPVTGGKKRPRRPAHGRGRVRELLIDGAADHLRILECGLVAGCSRPQPAISPHRRAPPAAAAQPLSASADPLPQPGEIEDRQRRRSVHRRFSGATGWFRPLPSGRITVLVPLPFGTTIAVPWALSVSGRRWCRPWSRRGPSGSGPSCRQAAPAGPLTPGGAGWGGTCSSGGSGGWFDPGGVELPGRGCLWSGA